MSTGYVSIESESPHPSTSSPIICVHIPSVVPNTILVLSIVFVSIRSHVYCQFTEIVAPVNISWVSDATADISTAVRDSQ